MRIISLWISILKIVINIKYMKKREKIGLALMMPLFLCTISIIIYSIYRLTCFFINDGEFIPVIILMSVILYFIGLAYIRIS